MRLDKKSLRLQKRIVSGVQMNCTPKVRQKKSNFWGAVQNPYLKGLFSYFPTISLINFKSTGVQAVIGSTFCHQGSMIASLDDASVVHYHDDIGIDNRR